MSAITLKLIFPNTQYVKYMNEITSTTLFTDMGRQIDDDGLYSQRIFGTVGSDSRAKIFAYIDLVVDIIHPRIYDTIMSLSGIYKGIVNGTIYAKFDKDLKDFVPSDILNGETGYSFFMRYVNDIKFKESDSPERSNKIAMIYKYRKLGKLTNNKLLVLPAGLREFSIDKNGKIEEVEINDYYRDILNAAKLLKNFKQNPSIDNMVLSLQNKVQELYKHLMYLMDGKKKLLNGSWSSRAVEFGTKTVAIGTPDKIEDINAMNYDVLDKASVSLVSYIKSIDPLAKHLVLKNFLNNIFTIDSNDAVLFTKKKIPERVSIPQKVRDGWVTNDGLDSLFNNLKDNDIRNTEVMIGDYYLTVLVDKGDTIEYYEDPYSIPEADSKYVRPITYGELVYLSVVEKEGKQPGFITRYPITEQGSIIPVKVYILTTGEFRDVTFIRHGIIDKEMKLLNYPSQKSAWVNGTRVPYSRINGLGLDYDGDQISLVMPLTEEAITELNSLMDSVTPYIGPDGKSMIEIVDKVVDNVVKFLTKH